MLDAFKHSKLPRTITLIETAYLHLTAIVTFTTFFLLTSFQSGYLIHREFV